MYLAEALHGAHYVYYDPAQACVYMWTGTHNVYLIDIDSGLNVGSMLVWHGGSVGSIAYPSLDEVRIAILKDVENPTSIEEAEQSKLKYVTCTRCETVTVRKED